MAKRQFLEALPYERFKFDKEQLGISFRLTKKQFEEMKGWEIERYETDMGYEIVWRVTRLMAHGDRTITATEDVPVSWWDHLKLDINLWARNYLLNQHFFFTNIARAIAYLPIIPKFRQIEKSILVKRFCPHVGESDNRPHIEFLMHKPTYHPWDDENGGLPYGGTGY